MCFSMATRHQMRMYLNYSNSSILSFKESHGISTKEVIENTLILEEANLGFIESVWHYQNKEYLLCEVLFINQFDEHFNSYEAEKIGFFEMVNIENLFAYHPLSVYYVSSKVLVPLHQHLCVV